jgi:hypothetical protein
VHPTKTRIVDGKSAGFEFLGFHVHKGRARTSGPSESEAVTSGKPVL